MPNKPLNGRILVMRFNKKKEESKRGIIIPDTAEDQSREGKVVGFDSGRRMKDGRPDTEQRGTRRRNPEKFGKEGSEADRC
jgi:co-chaperonin GroES (HSP10)